MAKRQNIKLIHRWWVNLVLSLALLAATYGFGSWAIDSGSMYAYALTVIFSVLAINRLTATVRYARS